MHQSPTSRIGLHPDRLCDRCEAPETVEHVIATLYQIHRAATTSETRSRKSWVSIFPPQKSYVAQLLRSMWKLLCESQAYPYRFSLLLPWHYKTSQSYSAIPPLIIIHNNSIQDFSCSAKVVKWGCCRKVVEKLVKRICQHWELIAVSLVSASFSSFHFPLVLWRELFSLSENISFSTNLLQI